MNILKHLLKDILIKFKDEKLPSDLKHIDAQRKKYNNELNKLLNSDNLIIEKYYKLQTGGVRQTFDAQTIAQLENLNNLLAALGNIQPGQVNEKTQKIKDITQKIITEINTISTIDIDINKLFDKIPQILDTTKLNIDSTKGFKIGTELSNLTIPLDISGVTYDPSSNKINGDFINSKKLNEMMTQMKQSYEQLTINISNGQTINESQYDDIKREIESKITLLEEQKTKLQQITIQLELKKTEFEKIYTDITITTTDLTFVDTYQTAKDVKLYIDNTSANSEDRKILEQIIKHAYGSNTTNIESNKSNFIKNNEFNFTKVYNENINKLSTLEYTVNNETKKLPEKCYRGSDTKAIANNILNEPVSNSISVMESVKNLLNTNIEEFKASTQTSEPNKFATTKFEDIYKPTFTGGAITIDDIKTLMQELNQKSVEYRTVYKNFVKLTEIYNKFAIYEIMHSIYLLSILSNSLFSKGGYQVYKYIGRGMINFYKRIIEKIFKELQRDKASFSANEAESELLLIEIRKKYYLTILMLKKFLNELSQKLTPNDIIDIDECSEKVLQYFTLLNHFKTILEKYNETQMNKLTIFSRINDIGMNDDRTNKDKNGEMLNLDLKQYYNIEQNNYGLNGNLSDSTSYIERLQYNIDNKLFISDYLRRNIYAGYYMTKNSHTEQNNPFDLTKNDLLKLELRELDSSLVFSNSEINNSYEQIKNIFNSTKKAEEKIEELEKYKKEILSKEISRIFSINFGKKQIILDIKQQISDIEIKIADKIMEIEDTAENIATSVENRKKDILIIKTELIELNKNLEIEKNKLTQPDLNENMILKIQKEIKSILLIMKISLEYLYATSPQINEKLMWIRNETCDAQKDNACSVPTPNPYTSTPTLNSPKPCNLPSNIPYLNSYKFTEVFDTQNFPNNQDMAAYMCLNTRISSGNGVCLITYGYSGTGKSYTLFGAPGKSGLLQGTLSKLDGLDKVYFRTFEIYGKGLPYVDYWYDNSEKDEIDPSTGLNKRIKYKKTKQSIYNYLYAYKLQDGGRDFIEGIKVIKPETSSDFNKPDDEWAVELKEQQITDYIEKSNILRDNIKNKTTNSTKYTKTENNKSDDLDYMEISNTTYQELFSNFSKFTDKIEEMRIRTQRVRETPNNKVSSRSILIYDFVLVINKDNQTIPVNFLIIDLPGREEIAPTFINKYTDYNTNPVLYNIIKSEFINAYNSNNINVEYKKLFKKVNDDDLGELYMKELRAMLSAFTLNPLSVPVFACEIIEQYLKDNYTTGKQLKGIIEKEQKKTITLYGEVNGVFLGNTLTLKDVQLSLLDDFYTENYSEKPFIVKQGFNPFLDKTSLQPVTANNIYGVGWKYSEQLIDYGLGWYSFRNLLNINNSGEIQIYGEYDTRDLKSIMDQFKSKINNKLEYNKNKTKIFPGTISQNPNEDKGKFAKSSYRNPYGLENNKYNGRQIKILFFINLIKRLIDFNRFDILNDMFEKIIDEKINKYIKKFISNKNQGTNSPSEISFNPTSDVSQIPQDLNSLISNLIYNNFKRDALKEKFMEGINYKVEDSSNNLNIKINQLGEYNLNSKSTQFLEKQDATKNYKDYIFDAIKYDFYTTGFEGIYINENIIGLIKYLGKDGKPITDSGISKMLYLIQNKTDRDMIEIDSQNEDNTKDLGKKKSNLIIISRDTKEKQLMDLLTGSSGQSNTLILPNYYDLIKSGKTLDDYIIDINKYIDPPSGSGAPAFMQGIIEGRAGGKAAIIYPNSLKYDENSKIKFIRINNINYLNSIYKKNDIDIINKRELGITPQTSAGAIREAGIITDPSGLLDYYYNPTALDEFFTKTIDSYQSSKIFCYDEPIIKSILNPYLDVIGDFKIFYLFGNYEKAIRELKCKQQYELLETTNNFIEAITR
jgi:hypothetical protein